MRRYQARPAWELEAALRRRTLIGGLVVGVLIALAFFAVLLVLGLVIG